MARNDVFFWCVRAGALGEADSVFLQQNHLAIGWMEIGDLSKLPADRETIKTEVTKVYPDKKAGAIPGDAGMLYRFLFEMKPGDLVIYPSKIDVKIHIGQIIGDYRYDPSVHKEYPNLRPVKWLKSFPRTTFTQGALYESNSSLTLFQIRNYAHEFYAALESNVIAPSPEDDITVAIVAEDIEQTTRDFIRKRLAQELKGHPFEDFVAQLLQTMGYRTHVTRVGSDGGVDIIAHKDELGLEPPIIKVQVKSTEGSTGDPEVSSLYGKVDQNEVGLFVTLGTFTPNARKFAASKNNLRLVEGEELLDLVLKHYKQLDSRYKGLIPLRKVYVPESLEGDNC